MVNYLTYIRFANQNIDFLFLYHLTIPFFSIALDANYEQVSCHRKMEQWCLDRGGYVALYAETFLTKEQFVKMFFSTFMRHYEAVRQEYGCEGAFPHIYEKISIYSRGRAN